MRRRSAFVSFAAFGIAAALGLSTVSAASAVPSDGAHLVEAAPEYVREAVVFRDVMYLLGTAQSVPGFWRYDGTTFSEVEGAPEDPYNLVVAEDAIYFYISNGPGVSTIGSFDGTTFAEYPVESVSGITPMPGGGVVFAGGEGSTYGLTFLKAGVFTQAVGGPNHIGSINFANGDLFLVGGDLESRRVYRYAGSTFTEIAGDYQYPNYIQAAGSELFFSGYPDGLFRVAAGAPEATYVNGSRLPLHSLVTTFEGGVYYAGASAESAAQLFEIVDGAATAVSGAPEFSQRVWGLGDSLYIGANPEGMSPGVGTKLFVYDGATFSAVPGVARSPFAFMELNSVDYFLAQVDGRTNAFGSWPSLFRVGLDPTVQPPQAAPALAATGADASIPLVFATLLLVGGGVAVGLRRRREV